MNTTTNTPQPTSKPCTTCGLPATTRCGGCNAHQPEHHVPWYCSKACQKAHWRAHKQTCKKAAFYTRVRQLTIPQDLDHINTVATEHGLYRTQFWMNMLDYLKCTTPAQRPPHLSWQMSVSPATLQGMVSLTAGGQTQAEYMRTWATRVPKELRDKCKTPLEYQVPFNMRPLTRHMDGKQPDIAMFPQDYETLSYEGFLMLFAEGQKQGINPFAQEQIGVEEGRIFRFG